MAKCAFTIKLEEDIVKKIKKIAKSNNMKTSELVNSVLQNFVSNFNILKMEKQVKDVATPDDETYANYCESLNKLFSSDDIPKDSKDFLVG